METSTWDIVGAIVALAGTIGSVIMLWWRVSSMNKAIKAEVAKHDEQIVLLITSKANCADLIKLAELVEKLDIAVTSHHQDTKRHRTEDFEIRLSGLIANLSEFMRENREDHLKILEMIRSGGKA